MDTLMMMMIIWMMMMMMLFSALISWISGAFVKASMVAEMCQQHLPRANANNFHWPLI